MPRSRPSGIRLVRQSCQKHWRQTAAEIWRRSSNGSRGKGGRRKYREGKWPKTVFFGRFLSIRDDVLAVLLVPSPASDWLGRRQRTGLSTSASHCRAPRWFRVLGRHSSSDSLGLVCFVLSPGFSLFVVVLFFAYFLTELLKRKRERFVLSFCICSCVNVTHANHIILILAFQLLWRITSFLGSRLAVRSHFKLITLPSAWKWRLWIQRNRAISPPRQSSKSLEINSFSLE